MRHLGYGIVRRVLYGSLIGVLLALLIGFLEFVVFRDFVVLFGIGRAILQQIGWDLPFRTRMWTGGLLDCAAIGFCVGGICEWRIGFKRSPRRFVFWCLYAIAMVIIVITLFQTHVLGVNYRHFRKIKI
jgi:hypothetical protein